jgi:two-component system, cell cycle response regulator
MVAQLSSTKQPGKLFEVAVIGAGESDLEIFERIFGITRYRARQYRLITANENSSKAELDAVAGSDIFIVNLHNPLAIKCWHKLAVLIAPEHRRPVLKISKITPSSQSGSEFTISWPLNPAKMLQSLDNYTIRHLHYYPEFEIGSEQELTADTVKNIKAINLSTQAQQGASPEHNIRVLIADDSLAVRRQLKIEFDLMSAQLKAVADGEAAVQAAEQEKFDLIFLDVVMPGMDGYAACKAIKRTSHNRNTPVVMLTSRSSNFDKFKGMLAGCDTYLTKPVNHNEFKQVTDKHLNKIHS